MKMVNLTPHDVCIRTSVDSNAYVFSRSGMVARVTTARQEQLEVLFDGAVPVYEPQTPNGVVVECESDADAIIVSAMVADYLQRQMTVDFKLRTTLDGTRDVRVFAPDTGHDSSVRDGSGAIVGVRRLVEYEPLDKAIIAASAQNNRFDK